MNEPSPDGSPPSSGRRRVAKASRLELAAETLALATVAVAPLALGAVHLPTTLALAAAGLVALGLLVAARPPDGIRVGWLALAFGAAALVTGLQLLPLPLALLRLVAPATAELCAYVLGDPAFHPLSLDLPATARELARTAGLAALLVVLQHRGWESRRARKRALAAVAGAGVLVSLLGLAHLTVSAKSFLGLWSPSTHPAFLTSFGNANHLAGYLGLAALLCLGLAAAAEKRVERLLWGAGFAVAASGSVFAGSRGGLVALGAGLVLLPLLGFRAERRASRAEEEDAARGAPRLVAVAAVVLLALGGWIYVEMPNVTREVDSLVGVELEKDAKLEVARTAARALGPHWFAGLGRGAFGTAHTRYLAQPWPVTFTHVENEPLQLLVELGVPVGGALVLALALAWLGLARRGRASWLEAGAAAAAFAILAQSLVDFSLEYAAGYALVALLAFRPGRSAGRFRIKGGAAAVAAAAAAAVALGAGLAGPGLDADTDRLLALAAGKVPLEELELAVRAAQEQRPADYLPCEVAASHALQAKGGAAKALGWVNRALYLNPHSARAHALAGEALARLGKRDQALLELRTAASLGLPTMATVLARFPEREAILAAAPLEPVPAAAAARTLLAAKRLEEAELVARGAFEASPGDLALATVLHSALAQLDRHEEALVVAGRHRAGEPASPQGWALEASSLLRLRRNDEARATYEAGLAVVRGDPSLVFGLCQLDLGLKQPDEALLVLDRMDPKAPPYAQATWRRLRAQAFRAKGDDGRARDELRLGLRLQPARQDLMLALAEVYLAGGRVDDAARELAPLPDTIGAAKALRARIEKKRAELEAMRRTLQGGAGLSPQ